MRPRLMAVAALVFAAFFSSGGAFAAKGRHASNVRLVEESGAVNVCYDLKLDIARVSLVGTGNGVPLQITAVSGDVGIVFGPADNLCVRWEYLQDYPRGLDEFDIFLDIVAKAYQPQSGEAATAPAAGEPARDKVQTVYACISDKFNNRMKAEKDAVSLASSEYMALLNNDTTNYVQMLQKLKGGVPYVRRYERDREGRQIPIYDTQEISDRERAKIQKEIDAVLDKAERNPDSVISSETRRAKAKVEQAIDRLFTRVAGLCEQETGVPSSTVLNLVRSQYKQAYPVVEPFSDIRRERDWN